MTDSIPAQIEALRKMTVKELQAKYTEVFGKETGTHHKQYLIKKIAWRIQELAYGGISEKARKRAAELADDTLVRIKPPKDFLAEKPDVKTVRTNKNRRDHRLPLPGTTITKEHDGRLHQVKILEKGFEYEGRPFRSLSAVAREITGAHWNGFLFFGLNQKRKGN